MLLLFLYVACFLVLVPIAVFSLECFLSLLPAIKGKRLEAIDDQRPRLAVIIPAHNEENGVSDTIGDVVGQLSADDRLLVVADNCSDQTADVARRCGAQVTVRQDEVLRGKSYALKHGLEVLSADPPEVAIFVDADCRLSENTLGALARQAVRQDRPVQGAYVFGSKQGSAASNLASSLTLRFKNYIRPLGSSVIGMPCQLTGSGMAFPWHTLSKVNVANGSLTEDAELGVDLALAGYPPVFCADAKIDGSVPKAWSAHVQQRRRWEQGYLQSIFTNAPKMVARAILGVRPALLWSALDLCIPPLALLAMLWSVVFVTALVVAISGGGVGPLLLSVVGAILMAASIFLGWFVHCRHEIGWTSLLAVPWFVIRKVAIYVSLIFNREKTWLRTDRD